jgi:Tol biopolymer transport system component
MRPQSTCIAALAAALLAASGCQMGDAVTPPRAELTSPAASAAAEQPAVPDAGTPTPTAAAPAAAAPVMMRLTEPGCCTDAFWSPDGREVRFVDRPAGVGRAGVYGVDVTSGVRRLVSERVGLFSADGRYLAYLNADYILTIEDTTDGRSWPVFNGARQPIFSPGSRRIAWSKIVPSGAFNNRRTTIYVADLDGANSREVIILRGGSIAGWLDDDRLLLLGRPVDGEQPYPDLFSLSVGDGTRVDLLQNRRIQAVSIAPGGEWVFYAVAFDTVEPGDNGLWLIRSDGSDRRRLDVIGGARWRDGDRLLIIPLEIDVESHRLLQIDAASGAVSALTDPETFAFRVAAGQWSISPTGEHVVFLNAEDQALWVFELPPAEPSE